MTKIPEGAFEENDLTTVEIPNSVQVIEDGAFMGNSLTSLTLPSLLIRIGKGAFSHNQLTSLEIPSSVAMIGASAFNDNQLSDDMAFIYKRRNDASEDLSEIVSYAGAKKEVVIPDAVKKIGEGAFAYSRITAVEIPDSVREI